MGEYNANRRFDSKPIVVKPDETKVIPGGPGSQYNVVNGVTAAKYVNYESTVSVAAKTYDGDIQMVEVQLVRYRKNKWHESIGFNTGPALRYTGTVQANAKGRLSKDEGLVLLVKNKGSKPVMITRALMRSRVTRTNS